jgi:predicted HTH domain antitoxin
MATISYPLRVSEKLMSIVELRSKEEYVDKTTALRQFIYSGAEDYVIELYKEGRISLGRAAELLNKSVHDIIYIAKKKGVSTGASEAQQEWSRKTAEKIK